MVDKMEFNQKEKNLLLDAVGTLLWEMENRLSVVQSPKELEQVRNLMQKLVDDREKNNELS